MIRTNLFNQTAARKPIASQGRFTLLEYERDLSVTPQKAQLAYFASKMNLRKRQVVATLDGQGGVILQAGAMQMVLGHLSVTTNIKGAGDLMKKFIGSKLTGETAVKPRYTGFGYLVLEPTYKYILFEDLAFWHGAMVIEDGMFLACDDSIEISISARSSLSSAVLGGEGLFNTSLTGNGVAVLESPVPKDEIIVVDLENDELRIDGSMAIAWSPSLEFTVERTTKTLVGSAASGEGLVNVYRGNGRVLIAPVNSPVLVPSAK
jgi:uncharacterized protein (AIM24 family)